MQNLKSFDEFIKNLNIEINRNSLFIKDEYIYLLPDEARIDKSLHYIRTGLLMGRIRNGRFEPSQALAMELKNGEWKNPLLLSLEDERVMKYLKCETIEADDEFDGYRLVCVDTHPLGWVKQSGTRCKNKYYPGWRYN